MLDYVIVHPLFCFISLAGWKVEYTLILKKKGKKENGTQEKIEFWDRKG
jgi:hypothetical protein